jgi:SAM-dependent methyltransferase
LDTRFENEGIGVRPAPACYLCQTTGDALYTDLRDRLFGAPGVWTLRRCPACGLVWVDPMPEADEIGTLYRRYYTHDGGEQTLGYPPSIERVVRGLTDAVAAVALGYADAPLTRGWRRAGRLAGIIGPWRDVAGGNLLWLPAAARGKALDVGCGDGRFLVKMRALGWEVAGIDPDAEAVRTARERHGLLVERGVIEDADLPEAAFDAVTLSHVIEHLPDPIGTLRACARILKPGGRIVVATPNTESLVRRMSGADWRGWEPPRHLHIFSTRTLRRCAERAGLRVLDVRTSARFAAVLWRAGRALRRGEPYPAPPRPIRDLPPRATALLIQLAEHTLSRFQPVGEELILVATRADGCPPSPTPEQHGAHAGG